MKMAARLHARLRRFARDKSGLAALEFALIAPMMLFLLFGSVELTNALNTAKRVENVSASLADVVSRDTAVTDEELEDLWGAIEPLMFPDTAVGVRARITSITIESEDEARVVWSEGHGGMAPRAEDSLVTLPDDMMAPGRSVILAEVTYRYDPVIDFVFGDNGLHELLDGETTPRSGFDISKSSIRRARLVDPVPRI